MTNESFQGQIKRLQSVWPNSYNGERIEILWKSFQHVCDADFAEAITECVANHRAAPLVKEIDREMQEVTKRNAQSRMYGSVNVGFGSVLKEAAENSRYADPEFVECCMKLIRSIPRIGGNSEEFLQGCDYLDQVAKQFSIDDNAKRKQSRPTGQHPVSRRFYQGADNE